MFSQSGSPGDLWTSGLIVLILFIVLALSLGLNQYTNKLGCANVDLVTVIRPVTSASLRLVRHFTKPLSTGNTGESPVKITVNAEPEEHSMVLVDAVKAVELGMFLFNIADFFVMCVFLFSFLWSGNGPVESTADKSGRVNDVDETTEKNLRSGQSKAFFVVREAMFRFIRNV